MVFIGKAASRPAKDGYTELLQCIEYVGAITVDVGNIGVFTYPKSTIDTSSQMLCKLAVDFFGMICSLWSVCKVIVALFCAKSDNEVERNMLLINNFVFIVF